MICEESIRKLLIRWLTGWGYQSGDLMMPEHDGIWLAEQVRNRWPETAVVMASSAQDMETVMRMRKQGAVDYVTKPFGREMLRQALQRASEKLGNSGE